MRRLVWALPLALILGCGEKPEPEAKKAPPPPPAAPKAPEIKSDPAGKNTCVKCALKTNEDACPKCKAPLKAAPAAPAAPKAHGEVGKSAVSGLYACPEPGCTFSEPKKGTCLKHTSTQMKEQWFVCDKCSKKEPVAGKCGGCGAELARKLQ